MKKSVSIVRYILGVILGLAAYVAGFYIAGFVAGILTYFQLYIPSGSVSTVSLTAAAIASNAAGIFVFSKVAGLKDESVKLMIPFEIIQICLAVVYGLLAILSAEYRLLWYTVLSIGINGFQIYDAVSE